MQYYCQFVSFVDPFSREEERSLHPSSEYNREINTRGIISVINFFIHKSKSLEHIFAQNLSPSFANVHAQKKPFLGHIQCLWVYTTHNCAYFSASFFFWANAGFFLLLPLRICTCSSNDLYCCLQLFFSMVIGNQTQQNMIDMNEPSYSMYEMLANRIVLHVFSIQFQAVFFLTKLLMLFNSLNIYGYKPYCPVANG